MMSQGLNRSHAVASTEKHQEVFTGTLCISLASSSFSSRTGLKVAEGCYRMSVGLVSSCFMCLMSWGDGGKLAFTPNTGLCLKTPPILKQTGPECSCGEVVSCNFETMGSYVTLNYLTH